MTAAWVFAVAWVVTSVLLVVAVEGDAELARESRRLRRELAKRRHPSRRVVDGGAL